ncbi:MAG: hypothetical protein ABUL44_03180, partial [Flavobacterium sp.]
RYSERITNSTITTNRWLRTMAVTTGVVTLIIALTGIFQYNKSEEVSIKKMDVILRKMDSIKAKGKADTVVIVQKLKR